MCMHSWPWQVYYKTPAPETLTPSPQVVHPVKTCSYNKPRSAGFEICSIQTVEIKATYSICDVYMCIYIVMIVYVCMCSLQLWFFLVFWLCGHFVFKPFSDRSVKTLRCERLDPNLTNFAGRTALLVACGFDHTEVVMQLLRSERRGLATWGLHGASTFGHWCLWSMGVSIIGI